jgi:hypothetical protein
METFVQEQGLKTLVPIIVKLAIIAQNSKLHQLLRPMNAQLVISVQLDQEHHKNVLLDNSRHFPIRVLAMIVNR